MKTHQAIALIVRWAARLLSLPLILICGFSLIACALPGPEQSLPHSLKDALLYAALVSQTLGLALAWKWELAGGALAFAAAAAGMAARSGSALNAGFLACAALFLLCGWLRRRPS